jgi:hypothetical protein
VLWIIVEEGAGRTQPGSRVICGHGSCQQRRVNVDFPVWMIESLDKEAKRLGVTRQSMIKVWIAERLQNA